MPNEIYLTRVGMTMTEGVVAEWLIADGDSVAKGDFLYRLETEKVELEVDADNSGIVKHLVEAGVSCEPGDVVGWIYSPDENIPDELPPGENLASEDTPIADPTDSSTPSPTLPTNSTNSVPSSIDIAARGVGGRILASPAARKLAGSRGIALESIQGTGPGGRIVETDVPEPSVTVALSSPLTEALPHGERIKASPVAKRLARELAIDLASIVGTGPNGRTLKADVENAATRLATQPLASAASPTRPTVTGPAAGETIPIRGMRKTIANNMHQSLMSTAQLSMDMEVQMDDAFKLRSQLISEWEAEGVRPGFTDLVVRAAAKALAQHPRMNSVMGETQISLLEEIHIGIAVALDEGLVVPVITRTLDRDVKSIALEATRLAQAARSGTLAMDEMHGGTFTVSSLGMFGVDSFTPILNPSQTGILGVNRIADGVRWEGERPVKCKVMRLSLTWDHRVLDGEPAAKFLGTIRDLLESPYRLLI